MSRYSQHLFVYETNLLCRVPWTPAAVMGSVFTKPREVSRPPRSYLHHSVVLLPLMMNVSNVGFCSYEGHVVVQRYGFSEVPTSISQTLVLFNVSTALRSLLIAPSNPTSCKKREAHTSSCDKAVCMRVFVCVQNRLS